MGLMASALARMGCRPDISWLEECLAVSRKVLHAATADQLVQLISALAALRFRPGNTWMQVCMCLCVCVCFCALQLLFGGLTALCSRLAFDPRASGLQAPGPLKAEAVTVAE